MGRALPNETVIGKAFRRRCANIRHRSFLTDVAETIAGEFNIQRREILNHVNRMIQQAAMKSSTAHDGLRVRNLHKRLVQLEAELRRLTRSRSP